MTVHTLIRSMADTFAQAGLPNARLEAEWLCARVLGRDRLQLFLHAQHDVTQAQAQDAAACCARRARGEPLQYILGTAEFFGLELEVGPGVLIPRPETEGLVTLAMELAGRRGPVLDLCTGSGAVALALAHELPPATTIVAVDISAAALAFAERNRVRLGATHVRLLQGDLYAALPADGPRFAVITANPPYIPPEAYATLPAEVRDHEPQEALLADEHGLAILRRIAAGAAEHLRPGGWLISEIGCEQGDGAADLFRAAGLASVSVGLDTFGKPRFVRGRNGPGV